MMPMNILLGILFLALYIGLFALGYTLGRPTRHTFLEHQRAVLFRRGLPVKEVGAGRYWVWVKREKFIFVDTRPIQVSFENQGAILKDGASAVFGILASARITDARKAIYSARNSYEVPAFVLHCCTRSVLNGLSTAETTDAKERLADDIIARAKPKLAASGFELLSLRVTQLSVAAQPQPQD
jgi:regulator of protease activity HflC (stomatin/prohibitin superfamily)